MRAATNTSGGRRDVRRASPARRARRGERGAAGPLGLVAVFVATAIVLIVVMLFVTGVAQQGILPRVRERALRTMTAARSDSVATQAAAPGAEAPAGEKAATATPESQPAQAGGVPGAEPGMSPPQVDSLRTLQDQIQIGRQSLDERITAVQQESARLEQQRTQADAESERRLKTLAKVYSSMKPEAAARVMAGLDDTTFTRVLQKLERRQAAKVLALIDPARVARLTQEAAASVADRGGN